MFVDDEFYEEYEINYDMKWMIERIGIIFDDNDCNFIFILFLHVLIGLMK